MEAPEGNVEVSFRYIVDLNKAVKDLKQQAGDTNDKVNKIHTLLVGDDEYKQKGFIKEHQELSGDVKKLQQDRNKAVWYVRGAIAVTGFNLFTSAGFKAFMVKVGVTVSNMFI